jgi:hypothetical protein
MVAMGEQRRVRDTRTFLRVDRGVVDEEVLRPRPAAAER